MTPSPEEPPHFCPLCGSNQPAEPVRGGDDRTYRLCSRCWLIAADPRHRLSRDEEAAHYRTHENSIHNQGYVDFLSRAVNPMLPRLDASMRGLDFGCGPGPTLSQILGRHGIVCDDYDPIFRDVPLRPPYDFLFATECFEHLWSPARELQKIRALLRPGAPLGIMTELWTDLTSFGKWHYTRDPTHVSFFHARTIEFICAEHGFELLWTDRKRVHMLCVSGGEGGNLR
jgi:hypothetical protein